MNRLAKHVVIRKDDILKDFLENPDEVHLTFVHDLRSCSSLQGHLLEPVNAIN